MAWLVIEPNTRVTLKLVEGVVHEHHTHWVDRSSKECTGPGCVYCNAGSKVRTRYGLSVQKGTEQFTWEFPGNVLDQLVNLLGDADKREGATVRVFRSGSGLDTRYVIEEAVAASAAPAPVQEQAGGDEWDVADAVWSVVGSGQFLETLGDLIEKHVKKAIVGDADVMKAIASVVGTHVVLALGPGKRGVAAPVVAEQAAPAAPVVAASSMSVEDGAVPL